MTAVSAKSKAVSVSRGVRFKSRVLDNFALEMAELEVLAEVVSLLDEIDALKAAIDLEGVTVTGSTGQTRTHPALSEVRSHRLAVQRLLAALGLPDEDSVGMKSPTQLRSAAGNRKRWSADNG